MREATNYEQKWYQSYMDIKKMSNIDWIFRNTKLHLLDVLVDML